MVVAVKLLDLLWFPDVYVDRRDDLNERCSKLSDGPQGCRKGRYLYDIRTERGEGVVAMQTE